MPINKGMAAYTASFSPINHYLDIKKSQLDTHLLTSHDAEELSEKNIKQQMQKLPFK